MTEKETEKPTKYFYAGKILLNDNTLGHRLVPLDGDESDSIIYKGKDEHWIGEIIEVKHNSNNTFARTRTKKDHDREMTEKYRIISIAEVQKHHEYLKVKKYTKERASLENKTIAQLREMCKGRHSVRMMIRCWIMDKF